MRTTKQLRRRKVSEERSVQAVASELTQKQLDEAVKEGNPPEEVQQAHVNGVTGEVHDLLYKRLDEDYRKLSTRINDIVISVADFGAVGDGVTDDSAAINSTIEYVSSLGGGTALLPRGKYLISKKILLLSKVGLDGVGRDATAIVPSFTEGDVIGGEITTKFQPSVTNLSIRPPKYANRLVGINFKYLQYGTVNRVDVYNCGIAFYLDESLGCYYNRGFESRTVTCGWGVVTADSGGVGRANANEFRDITHISPIIGTLHKSGNTNIFWNIKVETLVNNETPTIDYDGNTVGPSGRWVFKTTNGTGSVFEKFRAEFEGNLVSLGKTYGHYLKDFIVTLMGSKEIIYY